MTKEEIMENVSEPFIIKNIECTGFHIQCVCVQNNHRYQISHIYKRHSDLAFRYVNLQIENDRNRHALVETKNKLQALEKEKRKAMGQND